MEKEKRCKVHCHPQYLDRQYLECELPLDFYLLLVGAVKEDKGILKGVTEMAGICKKLRGCTQRKLSKPSFCLEMHTCILPRNKICNNGRSGTLVP